ncbi:aphids associated protein [Pueraria virus A]|uniref:Aphid transmission protein n=1 Tax=Pueraria virus A TaxID=2920400 RepID=A0A8T9E6H8_9VIRU|nr:aphids associated protein [Pueraria virus A]
MSSFNSPHIYSNKKYITLNRQDINRGTLTYLYSGGRGIDGCLHHLNNINTVSSSCLLLLSFICSKLGIKNPIIKEELDFIPSRGIADLIPSSSENPLKKDLEDVSRKLVSLQEQVQKMQSKLEGLDTEILKKILRHAESVDNKT